MTANIGAEAVQRLKQGKVLVEFTKADGTPRALYGTTNSAVIESILTPTTIEVKETKPRTVNPDVCRVFDLEKKEWRSFRIDSVYQYTVLG